MLVATVGSEVASGLGLSSALGEETADTLSFGSLEPLVRLMQETPASKLLPALTGKLKSGTDLQTLVASAGVMFLSRALFLWRLVQFGKPVDRGGDIPQRAPDLLPVRDAPVVVYCGGPT